MDLADEKQTKTIPSFADNAMTIVFIADCSDYDSITSEKRCQNRLQQSLERFKTIQNNKLDHSSNDKCTPKCSLLTDG
jgi:hypothetical protein